MRDMAKLMGRRKPPGGGARDMEVSSSSISGGDEALHSHQHPGNEERVQDISHQDKRQKFCEFSVYTKRVKCYYA